MLVALTLILSIFAMLLLNGSVAWFAENDSVTAGGFNVRVNSGMPITASLKSYPVTEINYTDGIYTASFDAESYTLPTEDPNGISYSEYKKALAIMITVNSTDERTVKIKFTSPSGIETIDDVENKISNCISISTARISEVDGKPTFTKIADTEASFVTINNGMASKVNEIELMLDNPNVSAGDIQDPSTVYYHKTGTATVTDFSVGKQSDTAALGTKFGIDEVEFKDRDKSS